MVTTELVVPHRARDWTVSLLRLRPGSGPGTCGTTGASKASLFCFVLRRPSEKSQARCATAQDGERRENSGVPSACPSEARLHAIPFSPSSSSDSSDSPPHAAVSHRSTRTCITRNDCSGSWIPGWETRGCVACHACPLSVGSGYRALGKQRVRRARKRRECTVVARPATSETSAAIGKPAWRFVCAYSYRSEKQRRTKRLCLNFAGPVPHSAQSTLTSLSHPPSPRRAAHFKLYEYMQSHAEVAWESVPVRYVAKLSLIVPCQAQWHSLSCFTSHFLR